MQDLLQSLKFREVPACFCWINRFVDLPDRVCNIADNLEVREVDVVDGCGRKVYVNDLGSILAHDERRFLNNVVTNVDDEVGVLDRTMRNVSRRKRRTADVLRVTLVDDALAHLCCKESNAGLVDKRSQHLCCLFAIRSRSDAQERTFRHKYFFDSARYRFVLRNRSSYIVHGENAFVDVFCGDVLRQFNVNGSRSLLHGLTERFTHDACESRAVLYLDTKLRHGPHHLNDVDNLKSSLLTFMNRLLPGDHEHRHCAELCVRGRRHEVGRPRSQCRKTNARLARESTNRRGHKSRRLLVARDDEFDG